jgi:hypothetical protein
MSYEENKKKIRSGDVLAWRGKGFMTMVSRVLTRSQYGHVGIAWVAGNRVFVLEAYQNKGVRIFPLSERLPADHFPLNVKWDLNVETLALEEVGRKYSKMDKIRAFFGREPKSGNGWQCAEYVNAILNKGGISVNADLPGYLVRELRAHLRQGESITKLL